MSKLLDDLRAAVDVVDSEANEKEKRRVQLQCIERHKHKLLKLAEAVERVAATANTASVSAWQDAQGDLLMAARECGLTGEE